MTRPSRPLPSRAFASLGAVLGGTLVVLLLLPLLALALTVSLDDLRAGLASPLFVPALRLSLGTTLVSLALSVALGTPLAWWLARRGGLGRPPASRLTRIVELLVELPIVIPPAVVGVALLQTFGRQGLLGPALAAMGVQVAFTPAAVVLAQVVVSTPFYVQAAATAFRAVDPDALLVARTLGASPGEAWWRVAVPIALPGLLAGASLAWARALGEFGATLLFAGNLSGTTQTLPLAIFTALESDLRVAIVFALILAGIGLVLLVGLRSLPALWPRLRGDRAHGSPPP